MTINKLFAIFKLLRPKQWIKNTFVIAPLIFAVKFMYLDYLSKALLATMCFCLISSVVYALNDIIDCEKDKIHPKKKNRPIASGTVTKLEASFLIAILTPLTLWLSYYLGLKFFIIILLYVLNNILYSTYVKHMVILDVMSIAAGFILRVAGGAFCINVIISPWILLCTLLLALFLGFSKRRHEITSLKEDATGHRKILEEYSAPYIDSMLSIVTASIVTAYSMYTFFTNKVFLMMTIPLVLYGIFRYQYIIFMKYEGGSPEEVVISDKPLMIDILIWIIASGAILYYVR